MIFQYLSEGFSLGLATGISCVAFCGSIYTPYLMQRKLDWKGSFISILKLSGGRFITYLVFGITAGFLGKQIDSIDRDYFTATAYILFSIFLLISAFRTHKREQGCQLSKWNRFSDSPFLLGLVTGINFCPSFLIALTRAIDLSGVMSGAFLFLAFFFGTNLFLIPFMIFGVMGNKKIFRTVALISTVVVSIWFISQAVRTFAQHLYKNQSNATVEEQQDGPEPVSILDSNTAYILTRDTTQFLVVRDTLHNRRSGPTHFITDHTSIPGHVYILVDPFWAEQSSIPFDSLKKEGRFVVIMGRPENTAAGYDSHYATQLVSFLDHYYFKIDTVAGSMFSLNKSSKKSDKK
ncbi:MAG: sulfite exporter TauE/SafE family protein [Chitinivibrionales bacterium]|nr:sulfite exporter TauE/SafE family protein [Chitinivibrionales bacterium]